MKKIKVLFVYSNLNQGWIQGVLQLLSEEFSKRKKNEIYLPLFHNTQILPFYGEIIDLKAQTIKQNKERQKPLDFLMDTLYRNMRNSLMKVCKNMLSYRIII